MPRGRKKDHAPSPANLFIAQDIRPRDLSDRRWKRPMERLAGDAAAKLVPNMGWGGIVGRIRWRAIFDPVFYHFRSGR